MRKLTRDLISGINSAPGLVGALVLLQLVSVRALASVVDGRVFVLGRELRWECWFKRGFNFPCPTCGLTRSVILTLHGRAGEAWQQNPAGLLLVCGLVLLGLALLYLAFYRTRHTPHASGAIRRRIRIATKVYAHLLVAVLFAHWLVELASR
ncbi:MAG: hypothetical protein QOD32_113 [Pyrinomonadaceae bacterium]|jgi:hypothetical protein|nr:hypothetical protein [Pyrinomonadaceae bacterium]